MCEKNLTSQSLFRDFIGCWCQKYRGVDQRQRAYYWSWQSHNWYQTLQYLAKSHSNTLISDTTWWTLDPTPKSADEVGVDEMTYHDYLDPSSHPWDRYPDVCQQFASGLEHSSGTPTETKITQYSCAICTDEIGTPIVFNEMKQLYNDFDGPNPHTEESARQFQLSFVSGDALNRFVDRLVNQYNLDASQIRHDAELLLANINTMLKEKVIIAECPGNHPYHKECIREWYTIQKNMYQEQLQGIGLFAPLQGSNKVHQELQFGPFSCPLCRTMVSSVQVPPGEISTTLTGTFNYNLSPWKEGDQEIGPYRLRLGALVWYYPLRLQGSQFAGQLAIINDYVPASNSAMCNYGGCFNITPVFPEYQDTLTIPTSCVFDISFFELDVLPTRQQVTDIFSQPLSLQLSNPSVPPYCITEDLGLFDLQQAGQKDVVNMIRNISQSLQNPNLISHLTDLLTKHRLTTESSLSLTLGGGEERFTATQLLEKMLMAMGYYQSAKPLHNYFTPIMTLQQYVSILRNMLEELPETQNVSIPLAVLYRAIYYARAGYNILPLEQMQLLHPGLIQFFQVSSHLTNLPIDDRRIPHYQPPLRGEHKERKMESRVEEKKTVAQLIIEEQEHQRNREKRKKKSPKETQKRKKQRVERKKKEEKKEQDDIYLNNIRILKQGVEFLNRPAEEIAVGINVLTGYMESRGVNIRTTPLSSISEVIRTDIINRLVNVLLTL